MTDIPEPVRLAHPSGAMAEVLVGHGAIVNRLHIIRDGLRLQIVEPMDTDDLPSAWGKLRGVPVMFPFPGRVRGARYPAQGRTHTGLPVNDPDLPGNHIHGLVATLPWALLERSSLHCTSQVTHDDLPDAWRAAYPFPFELRLTHRLAAASLRLEFDARNLGDTPLPFGLGLHPYFSLPFGPEGSRGDCLVEVPADRHWPQEEFMPVGRLEPVPPELDLRHPTRIADLSGDPPNAVYSLAGLRSGQPAATLQDPFSGARLELHVEGDWQALVLFRPPQGPSICLEPQTCVPNAVNLQSDELDTGWLELPPSQTWSGAVEFRVAGAQTG